MERIKRGNNWGYEFKCGCCESKIFRTQAKLDSKPLHFCKTCTAAKACYYAAIKNKIHYQNNSFFKEQELKTFYWAGFIAADGYVNEKENYLQIRLSQKDAVLLEKFIKDTGASNSIFKNHKEGSNETSLPRFRVVVNNKTWIEDLGKKFNVHQCKSLTHNPPDITSWSKEQIKAFIIGYADGDGTICYCGQDKYLKFSFIGTLEFLSWVKNFIVQEYQITLKDTAIQHKKNCLDKNVYELNIYCSKALKVLTDLKQLPIYKLERKWSKV
jgi:hypothetical protein